MTTAAYLPGLRAAAGGDFLYDDRMLVSQDTRLADEALRSPGGWVALLAGPYHYGIDNLHRPVATLTYATQRLLHGERLWAFRVANLILHVAATWLVVAMTRRLASADAPSSAGSGAGVITGLVAGLAFASHPSHVEAVVPVYGRPDLLVTVFVLTGLLAGSARPLGWGHVVGILASGMLAIGSKEPGMLFVAVSALFVFTCRPDLRAAILRRDNPRRPLVLTLAASLLLMTATYVLWRESTLKFWWDRSLLDPATQPLVRASSGERLAGGVAIFGRYLVLLVWPLPPAALAIDHGWGVIPTSVSATDPYLWTGLAGLTAFAGSAIRLGVRIRRDNAAVRPASFAMLAFAVTLLPFTNLPTLIGTPFGERLLYLPSAFAAMALGLTAGRVCVGRDLGSRVAIGGLVTLGSMWGVRTATYAAEWSDAVTFHEAQVRRSPEAWRLRLLLAEAYADAERPPDRHSRARRLTEDVTAALPWYDGGWSMRAYVAIRAGRLDAAADALSRAEAIRISPRTLYLRGLIDSTRAEDLSDASPRSGHDAASP